jgi:hypothetical protein
MRIAGKDFTTLAAVQEMKLKCRVPANQQDYGLGQQAVTAKQHGSSSTAGSSTPLAAALMMVEKLSRH